MSYFTAIPLSIFLALNPARAAAPPEPLGAATRLKDVAGIEGVRDNQLMGYGLVVGLAGTGDKRQTVFSVQALTNILKRMGVNVEPTAIQVRNIAGVMVTASLPPFAQPGTRIDITAAAIGDASNLQGGMLLMTPLKGPDGQVYAVAQGSIMTGGFVAGRGGASQTVNHPTVGRLPEGAIVEKAPPSVAPSNHVKLQLRQADFTTASRVVAALNKHFAGEPREAAQPAAGSAPVVPAPVVPAPVAPTSVAPVPAPVAKAESSALIDVNIPASYANRTVEFIAEMENLLIEPDHREKVVMNERTGTIVMGKDVRISPVAILHGALNVKIETQFDVSQPAPLSNGVTAVTPDTSVTAKDSKAQNILLKNGATVEDLVRALQAIGSTPRDVIAILQSMKAAGALNAEIEVI